MPVLEGLKRWAEPDGKTALVSGGWSGKQPKAAVCERHCMPDFEAEVRTGRSGLYRCSDGDHHAACPVSKDRCRICRPGTRDRVLWYQSRQSKRRMLERVAALARYFSGGYLATLTYGAVWPSFQQVKRDLDVLGKRFARAFPCCGGIWLLESQDRGAPHYHIVMPRCCHGDEDMEYWFWKNWFDITGLSGSTYESRRAHAVDVTGLGRFGGLIGYLSKELGKKAQKAFTPGDHPGRWWGKFGQPPDWSEMMEEPDTVRIDRAMMGRINAANDAWSTGTYWEDPNTGRIGYTPRTWWSGDVAQWILTGAGTLRGPPKRRDVS